MLRNHPSKFLCLLALCFPGATAANSPVVDSTTLYQVENVGSQLDLYENKLGSGSGLAYQWSFHPTDQEYFYMNSENSNFNLNVGHDGNTLTYFTHALTDSAFQFKLVAAGEGNYFLFNRRHTTQRLCKVSTSAELRALTTGSGADCQWRFNSLEPTFQPTQTPTPAPTPKPTLEPTFQPTQTPTFVPEGTCFHGATQVTLEDKSTKAMTELQVGDKIQTADIHGNLDFAPIISLPHKPGNSEMATFLKIATDSGKSVQMTPGHLIPNCAGKMFSANEVALGDCVMTVDGKETVSEITSATHFGVYTAVTAHALIVADSIIASPFSVENDPHRHKDNNGISSPFLFFLNKISAKVSTGLRGAKVE